MNKLGIVKNYLKFKLDSLFGVIGCEKSNISYLPNKSGNIGSLCMIGFAEDVIIWNMRTNEIVETIHGAVNDRVTFLTYFNSTISGLTVSIGYESGYVSVYSLWNMEKLISLKCHKHAITHIIHCKPYGEKIICGSKDTSITVIDIPEEKGFEMKGHVSPITKLHYIWEKDVLISSSQDGNIKFWTLGERHCFKTLTNTGEAWDFHYCETQRLLITGSSDALIRMWKLEYKKSDDKTVDFGESLADAYSNMIQTTYLGEVQRDSSKRIVEMKVDQEGSYLACNTAERKMEIYKILTEAELKKRMKKKSKKAASSNVEPSDVILMPTDRLKLVRLVDLPARCKSVDVMINTSDESQHVEILASLHNNTVATMYFDVPHGKQLVIREHVTQPGHRTAIIHAQMTSDKMGLFTVSLSEAKLWEKSLTKCLFTFGWSRKEQADGDDQNEMRKVYDDLKLEPGVKLEASTALLLPGDRHAVIGFKNGVMLLFHLVDGTVQQAIKEHHGTISALTTNWDKTGIISTSSDKTMKLWKLEYGGGVQATLGTHRGDNRGCLRLALQEQHGFDNGISCIAATSDGQQFFVGFLDNKVRTYLTTDTKKRILDLHGHTEPATSISVKHDNSQILTGSSDKTVNVWNLPFGDRKTFRGHTEPVTDVKYVPGRSMAFTADKGGLIIQIDLKNMTEIFRLRGHGAQITCLAIEASGNELEDDELENAELVSVSTDGSIRLWYESEEILSKEVEEMDEMDAKHEKEEMVREEIIIVGAPRNSETNILTKKTINTERCADELIEALDTYDKLKSDPQAVPDLKMTAMGFTDRNLYVLEILRRIKSGDLEFALAQLPLSYVAVFFEVLCGFLMKDRETLLTCRCLLFLGKIHFKFLTNNEKFRDLIDCIATYAPVALKNYESLIGLNIEAFQYCKTLLGPELQKFTEKRNVAKSKSKNKNK